MPENRPMDYRKPSTRTFITRGGEDTGVRAAAIAAAADLKRVANNKKGMLSNDPVQQSLKRISNKAYKQAYGTKGGGGK